MPFYICRKSVELIRRVEDPESPEQWRSQSQREQTLAEADRRWYCEQITADNPETTEEGESIKEGNYCIWFRWWDGTYRKTESEKEFFEQAYILLDDVIPNEDPTTRTDRPDITA